MSGNSASQSGRNGSFDVFLSAVTSEFQMEREQLRDWLRKKRIHVIEERDFTQGGGTLWEYLKERIAGSPAIVCLIGAQSGSDVAPAEAPEGSPPRTYTQWEFWLGWGEKPWSPPRRRRILVYFPADLEKRLTAAEAAARGDLAAEDRLRRQREHISKVSASGIHYESFTDPDHLIKLCLAQDLLCQRTRKWALGLAAALAVLIGMVWMVLAIQGKQGAQLQKIEQTNSAAIEQGNQYRQLVEDLINEFGTDLIMVRGKGEESQFDYMVTILAKKYQLTVEETRNRLALGAALIQQDPAATLSDKAKAAFALKDFAKAYDLSVHAAEMQTADLADNWMLAGLAAYQQARFSEAAAVLEKALALRDKTKNPLEWATTAIWLGVVYDELAAYAKAEPLDREVLSLCEAIHGKDHPDVATALNALAMLLATTNRQAEAEPLYRRALAISEKSFGPDHPNVSTLINNLAMLMDDTSRSAEAEPLARRALAIDEKSFGSNHPKVAMDLNNLGTLLVGMGRSEDAEPLFRRALTIFSESFGPDHPNVALARNNLAATLLNQYRLMEVEPLYRQALMSSENIYGPDHPKVALHLVNLAGLLLNTNRASEAEALYRRALAIDEKSLGPDHPDVATCLHNLARTLQATDRLVEAEPLYRRAVVILATFEKRTGHEHPDFKQAVISYEFALVFLERPNIPETVASAVAGKAEK